MSPSCWRDTVFPTTPTTQRAAPAQGPARRPATPPLTPHPLSALTPLLPTYCTTHTHCPCCCLGRFPPLPLPLGHCTNPALPHPSTAVAPRGTLSTGSARAPLPAGPCPACAPRAAAAGPAVTLLAPHTYPPAPHTQRYDGGQRASQTASHSLDLPGTSLKLGPPRRRPSVAARPHPFFFFPSYASIASTFIIGRAVQPFCIDSDLHARRRTDAGRYTCGAHLRCRARPALPPTTPLALRPTPSPQFEAQVHPPFYFSPPLLPRRPPCVAQLTLRRCHCALPPPSPAPPPLMYAPPFSSSPPARTCTLSLMRP